MSKMKAIVFKHECGGTYVLDSEGSFSFINGYTSQLIGAEVEITSQPSNNLKKLSSLAACLILLLSLSLFISLWTQTSHFVYVDINPSIELQFNRFDRLRTVTTLNDDGAALLGNMDLRGASDRIIVDIINEAIEQGFLVAVDGKPGVLITVVPAGGRLPDTRISAINQALERNGMNGFTVVETGSKDLKDRAEEHGVSPGKLMLAEAALQASGGQTPLEDLLQKRIEELFDAIKDAKTENSGGSAGYYAAPTESSDDNPDASQSPESPAPERRGMNPANADIPLSTGNEPFASPGASPDSSPRKTRSGNPSATGSHANDLPPGRPVASESQPNPNSGPAGNSGNNLCNANNPCGKPDCNRCNNNGNNNGAQPTPNSGAGNNSGNNPCNANNPCGKPDCNRCNNNGNNNGAQPNPNSGPGNNSGNNPCNANNPCGKPDCNRCNNSGNSGNNGNNGNSGNNGNNGNNPCNANNPCGEPDCNRCNNSGNSGNNGNNG